jgi:hypothetical protein
VAVRIRCFSRSRDPWFDQEFIFLFSLIGLNLFQHVTEPLVGDDVALGYTALLVEGFPTLFRLPSPDGRNQDDARPVVAR